MRRFLLLLPIIAVLLISCNRSTSSNVASTKYYHKYGFEIPKNEWEQREQNGKVVTTTELGVTITKSYENGVLNGPTTITYPNSSIISKKITYDQGILLKEIIYDEKGIPIRESDFEFEDQIIKTCWDENGTPISVEEFKSNSLNEGKYYDKDHSLEASVISGNGLRVKRDRKGSLLQRETVKDGKIISRICYYPNGNVQSETNYQNEEPHGLQKKYTENEKPLAFIQWEEGILHGVKLHFKNGKKFQELPYTYGMKDGIEKHYDQNEKLTAEIPWVNNQRHGRAMHFSDEETIIKWYYEGKQVTQNQYESFNNRSQVVADLTGMFSTEQMQ